nr:DUF6131 family protein [Mycolicibacterium hodleri]
MSQSFFSARDCSCTSPSSGHIHWTIGPILVVGPVLMLLGSTGRAVVGRRAYG